MKATLWKQSDSVLHVQLKGGGSLARAMVDALDLGEGGTRSATTSPTLGAPTFITIATREGESLGQLLSFVLQRLTMHGVAWEFDA